MEIPSRRLLRARHRPSGFTLLEVALIVAIIGMMMLMIIGYLFAPKANGPLPPVAATTPIPPTAPPAALVATPAPLPTPAPSVATRAPADSSAPAATPVPAATPTPAATPAQAIEGAPGSAAPFFR
jgi:hypothetical protein